MGGGGGGGGIGGQPPTPPPPPPPPPAPPPPPRGGGGGGRGGGGGGGRAPRGGGGGGGWLLRGNRISPPPPALAASPPSHDWWFASGRVEGHEGSPAYAPLPPAAKAAMEGAANGQEGAAAGADGGEAAGGRPPPGSEPGFKWRSGKERTTMGIWMWSRAFLRTAPSGERVAVLLMDTQGLWDRETSQMLTNTIFGLSALISSYLVFNIPNRVDENTLQNLALFAEYGRQVLQEQSDRMRDLTLRGEAAGDDDALTKSVVEPPSAAGGTGVAAVPSASATVRTGSGGGGGGGGGVSLATQERVERLRRLKSTRLPREEGGPGEAGSQHPFQRIELLVRDADLDASVDDGAEYEREMAEYLEAVLDKKARLEDVATVRNHITASFEAIGCCLLPHPGLEVRNRAYDGSVTVLQPAFRTAVTRCVAPLIAPTPASAYRHPLHPPPPPSSPCWPAVTSTRSSPSTPSPRPCTVAPSPPSSCSGTSSRTPASLQT
jgi:hypothetical protein